MFFVSKLKVFSSNVFNALKSHSIFLQTPVLAGLIIKFIQDTLIIVQQSSEVYALYSVAILIGSVAVVGARGAIRPLSPYVWSKENNSISISSYFKWQSKAYKIMLEAGWN